MNPIFAHAHAQIECHDDSPSYSKDSQPPQTNKPLEVLYPTSGLYLLPMTLAPLVGSRQVIGKDGRSRPLSEFTTLRLADFETSEGLFFTDQIADVVQTLLYSRKSIPTLRSIVLSIPQTLRLTDLSLGDRARVALQSRAFFDSSGQWRTCNLHEIISTHGMGARLLMALLLGIEDALARHESRPLMTEKSLRGDLMESLGDTLYAPRSGDVFTCLHGWDGKGGSTLVKVSKKHGISKERARQILSLAEVLVTRSLADQLAPKRLLSALLLLDSLAPLSCEEAALKMLEAQICDAFFHPQGILSAAKFWGADTDLVIEHIGGVEMVIKTPQKQGMHALQALARSISRSIGLVSDEWLMTAARRRGLSFSESMVRMSLLSDDHLVALKMADADESSCKSPVWFCSSRAAKPTGIIVCCLKLMAFFGSVSAEVMLENLMDEDASSDFEFPGPLSLGALESLLRRWGMSRSDDGCWSAQDDYSRKLCEKALPVIEKQIAQMLRDAGGALDKCEIQSRSHASYINLNTLHAYLRRSPLLAKPERGSNFICLVDPV